MAGSIFDLHDLTDRDLLVMLITKLDDHTEQDRQNFEELKHMITGNGQPGLLDRVAKLEGATPKRDAAKYGGIVGAIATTLALLIERALGWLSVN